MNISVHIQKVIRLMVLFISPLGLFAQSSLFEGKQVLTNHSFTYNYSAINAALSVQPKHGTAVVTPSKIIYTPAPNFVGRDTFLLNLMTFPPVQILYKGFAVDIADSYITTKADYANTATGQPVSINVLKNDLGTSDLRALQPVLAISSVHNGVAEVISDSVIRFTPKAGFEGTAFVNYIVCDEYENCKNGDVFITVSSGLKNENQSLSSAKNQSIPVFLAANGYSVTASPSHGTLVADSPISFRFKPTLNYVGTDNFTFSKTVGSATYTTTVQINILPAATPNQFVIDDAYNTVVNTPISMRVQRNDIAPNFSVISFTQPAQGGTVTNSGGDNFTFTPTANFKGIAQFTYTAKWNSPTAGIPFYGGVAPQETATVSILVSNQAPSLALPYNFVTPRNTAFVIDYGIPLNGYNFEIIDPANHGTATFYGGSSSNTYNGQLVTGYNLIVYVPNTDFTGNDEFQVRYCMNGDCKTLKASIEVKNIAPSASNADFCVGSKCVWSGDANSDGVVSMSDLLPIGYSLGEAGTSRPEASVNWFGQFGENWSNPFVKTSADLKYVDTDGNGFISSQDTVALSSFYGLTHNFTSDLSLSIKKLPLYFQQSLPVGVAQPGDLVEIDIILGKTNDPAVNVSGLALSFDYDASKVVDSMTSIAFEQSSWIKYGASTLSMVKKPWSGRLDAGLTRTSGSFASGIGKIGTVSFIVDDDIAGFQLSADNQLRVRVSVPAVMDGNGVETAAENQEIIIPIGTSKKIKTLDESLLVVAPNPTTGLVRLHLNGGFEIQRVAVFNLMGMVVAEINNVNGNDAQTDLSQLASGIYFVQALTKDGVIIKKIEVVK